MNTLTPTKEQNESEWDRLDSDNREILEGYGYRRGMLLPGFYPGQVIGDDRNGYWQATETAWIPVKIVSVNY